MPKAERLKSLRRRLGPHDAFLVTSMQNLRWLTGFTGSAGYAVITKERNIFVTDFRYKEQSGRELEGWDIVIETRGRASALKRMGKRLGIRALTVEDTVSVGFYKAIRKSFRSVKPAKAVIEKLRAIKDVEEIISIRKAVGIAESAFSAIKPYIKAGMSESAIAARLEERLRKEGSEGLPFDIIVAGGENSALPHARPSGRRLRPGDLVIVDWGARSGGYCADMTRTLLLKGHNLSRQKEIYGLVLRANRRAVEKAAPGVGASAIDRAAREVIEKAGYGEFFGHAVGHGVGLDVHELPRISQRSASKVREAMVFTVEPGIYVPGLGGVRIEDMVMVGARGTKALTALPRKLEII